MIRIGFKILIFISVSFIFISLVRATGIAVKPSALSLKANIGKNVFTRFIVVNPSASVAIFDVYPDELESLIKISPSSFVLESGEKRQVLVGIKAKESGRFKTDISVVAKSLSQDSFNVGSGVKIPLDFEISPKNSRLASILFLMNSRSNRVSIILVLFSIFTALYFFFIRYLIRKISK